MSLLDLFRSRPAWEDPDPDVRLAAVRQLPAGEQSLLAEIARTDAEPAVRRAATRKLDTAEVLEGLAREDPDENVREEAAQGLLRGLLVAEGAAAASAPLHALTQPRHLAVVARKARSEAIRRAALERIDERRALLSVAKSAEESGTRLEALSRIAAEDLAEVAVKSEHRDVATAAVERLDDVVALQEVAAHGRNKAAARRARTRLEELTGARQPVNAEERRAADLELCRRVEALESGANFDRAAEVMDGAKADWQRLTGHEPEMEERFSRLCAEVEGRLARHRAEQAERARVAESRSRSIEERLKLCEQVEALSGAGIPEAAAEAQSRFHGLPEEPGTEELERRFARAVEEARKRHEGWLESSERRAQLEGLCAQLEKALDDGTRPAPGLIKQAEQLASAEGIEEALRERQRALDARYREIKARQREERALQRAESRKSLVALVERIEALAGQEKPALAEARAALRESRGALEQPGQLSKGDREELLPRLKTARGALYPKVQELSEAEDWRLWSNAAVQEELCRKMEALVESADLDRAARQLRDLKKRWKQVGSARREDSEALWQRFCAARDAVQERVSAHLAARAEQQAGNLKKKLELCERAEALQGSQDWARTADALKLLQAEWKSVGPVPRRQSQETWQRFRRACDAFFEARKSDLHKRKEEWGANLEQKMGLIERAESLVASTDWEASAEELKQLQARWKEIGPVRRNKAEAIWTRFRAACNAFFERFKRRDEISRDEEVSRREELCAELEGLLDADPDGLAAAVEAIHARWRSAGPLPAPRRKALERRYREARFALVERHPLAFAGTELDPELSRARLQKLCDRADRLLEQERRPTGVEDLAARLREALAANTIGGGAASSSGPQDELAQLEAAYARLGPVPGPEGEALHSRFKEACEQLKLVKTT
jgi:hypothetical protein